MAKKRRGNSSKRKAVKGSSQPGVSLELIVARIQQMMEPQSVVTHNEKLVDRVGNTRQFDVVIRGHYCGRPMLGVIECKDHKTKKGPREVGAFAREAEHVNANLKIMVSRKGFTKQALRLARHDGVDCLSLLPEDFKKAGFSIGHFWYGIVREWTDVRLVVRFATKPAPINQFAGESVRCNGLPVVNWFLRELFTKYSHDKEPGLYRLSIRFRETQMLDIDGTSYPVAGLAVHGRWVVAKKRKWVTWTGDGFYDWHEEKVFVPGGATLVGSPVETDISLWDDYDGEIPPLDGSFRFIARTSQMLRDSDLVPELGKLPAVNMINPLESDNSAV